MARPKGTKQKRDESKYWLPSDVVLKSDQNPNYIQDTVLQFVDINYGIFESTFKAIRNAKGSTHPEAVNQRRKQTNIQKYGFENVSLNKDIQTKRNSTMQERYGSNSPLGNAEIISKVKQTNLRRYNVEYALSNPEIRKRVQAGLEKALGVKNCMLLPEVKAKLVKTSMERHGVPNGGMSAQAKESYFKTIEANGTGYQSKCEKEIMDWITSLGLACKQSHIGGADPKQLDIKIPELNLAIEYNGLYWHNEANNKMTPQYHLNKTNLCKDKGIRLIHIFDYEWETRQSQVKSFLLSALGKNRFKVFARKCTVKKITNKEANLFLNQYHILGSAKIKQAYGLFHGSELLQVVTIGLHHRNNKEYVLNRFCGKTDYTVIGGLSKLTAVASLDYGTISTWIDLRFSDGSNWVKAGWEIKKTLKPDYFYFDSTKSKMVSKQSRMKSVVKTPAGMTEHQHALQDKLYRVYDCGKIKLTFKL